jgi:hypothetical protein
VLNDDQGGAVRRGAQFRRLVTQLREECLAQQVEPSTELLEDVLAAQIEIAARAAGIQETTVLRSYADQIDLARLAEQIAEASQQREHEIDATPHAILPIDHVGRLIASLGQAVRCVSLNHGQLSHRDEGTKWDAISVLDAAGDGLTLIGASLQTAMMAGNQSVVLSDEAIVFARRALTQTIANLKRRQWSFGDERPEIDAGVVDRMASDLALLPPS